jgi:ArsR family metal-binding transcriptional regulator
MKKRIPDLIEELIRARETYDDYVFGVKHTKYSQPLLCITDEVQFRITANVTEQQIRQIVKYIRNSYQNVYSVQCNKDFSMIVALFSEQ